MRDGLLLRFVGRGREPEPESVVGTVTRPHWPIGRCLVCAQCDSCFEASGDQACPACGSKQAISLGRGSLVRVG
jgi:hypothetical protein